MRRPDAPSCDAGRRVAGPGVCRRAPRRRPALATALRVAIALLAVLAPGCAHLTSTPPPRGWLAHLRAAPDPPAGRHLPLPPARLEELLRRGAGEIRSNQPAPAGITGPRRLTLFFPSLGREIDVKWKPAPSGDLDGWDNAPRKELAAYAIQKWFLEPRDYVVPPTVGHCFPLDAYRAIDPDAKANLRGTRCVFGIEAAWLHGVDVADPLYEPARFYRDPAYARGFADFNLLVYLIENCDEGGSNTLAATDEANRRVFSIDNGIAFDPVIYNYFRKHWAEIEAPALPRDAIARLRRLTPERVHRLAVVAQFARDRHGVLRPVPPTPAIAPDRGVGYRDGVLQLGLTSGEIADVWSRVQALLSRVDAGEIPLF